ncbi:MAG: Crp/Fnr family transcriptional regulator [Rhodocyclaceae bacterium]|nr:Crp/Fnr family transcriptional regulator [Rhodocyclaceae bacterium]
MLFFDFFRDDPDLVYLAVDQQLLERDDDNAFMYVLLDGHMALCHGDGHVESLGPGDFFGEEALLAPGPSLVAATAQSTCTLARISHERFLFLVRSSPGFAIDVLRVMSRRLRSRPIGAEHDARGGTR